jgi:hypothetical protein
MIHKSTDKMSLRYYWTSLLNCKTVLLPQRLAELLVIEYLDPRCPMRQRSYPSSSVQPQHEPAIHDEICCAHEQYDHEDGQHTVLHDGKGSGSPSKDNTALL